MAVIHKFGKLVVSLDGSGEYAVEFLDGFSFEGERGETVEEIASSVLRQVGLKLIEQDRGLNPIIIERMERIYGGR